MWSPSKAVRHVVGLAKKHAKADFARDPAAAARLGDDAVADLASEGFWNVVFPKLENEGVDPATEVDGVSIERHYINALKAAYRDLKSSDNGNVFG